MSSHRRTVHHSQDTIIPLQQMLIQAISLAQLWVYDPKGALNVEKTKKIRFSHGSAAELFAAMAGQPHRGMFDFGMDIFKAYDCVVATSVQECDSKKYECDVAKMHEFAQGDTLSAARAGEMIQLSLETCKPENTAVILLRGASDKAQTSIAITVSLVVVSLIVLLLVSWIFVAIDDEKPDDQDDDMNPLLYNAPEMMLAPEAFLDDEPWEAGGDDY